MPNSQSGAWQPFPPPFGMEPDNRQQPVDPYLIWAAATGFAGYPLNDDPKVATLPVLLELSSPLGSAPAEAQGILSMPEFASASATLQGWAPNSRYQTWFVPYVALDLLVLLQKTHWLKRFQLGAARGTSSPADVSAHSVDVQPLLPIDTLGVVDDGGCFAHEAFRGSAHNSRFEFVWDQTLNGKFRSPWNRLSLNGGGVPPGYGGELRKSKIDDLLKAYPKLGEAGERKLYSSIDRPTWGEPDRIHGACVLHTFAGPATFLPQPPSSSRDVSSLPIIFVQLPDQTVADTSGGSIGFYVLDAVRYIIQRTKDLNYLRADKNDWSSTINVSLGSLGGPHDGSTIVEQALDETVETYTDPPSPANGNQGRKRVRIVMAAGNMAEHQIHGVRDIAPGKSELFHVMAPPGNDKESFVELWPQLATWNDIDALSISVFAPDGSVLRDARVGSSHVLRNGNGKIVASLVFPRAVAQGTNGPMILLAVRPTENVERPGDTGPCGAWTVQVASALAAPVTVHGWVERNDTVIKRRTPQRTVFINSAAPGDDGGWLSENSTLSSLANGKLTDCVGGFEINRMRVTDYSSRGPALRNPLPRPGIYGASDVSASLPGIACPGFFSGTRARFSGSSSAAPRVARWIAEGSKPEQQAPLDPGHSTVAMPSPALMGVQPLEEVEGSLPRPAP